MQADQITLNVDELNNGTDVPSIYSRYEETQNRSVYITADHTPATREQFTFFRSAPTRTGNFKGVQKSSVKFTKDTEVLGVDGTTLASAIIVEISFSIPAGIDASRVLRARQVAIAMLDDDTVMDKLNIQLMV